MARQLQGLSSFKRIPSRTRRTTDSNLALEAPSSAFSQVAFSAMAKARRGRRATEDNVLHGREGAVPQVRSSSPLDDEEDSNSERLPVARRASSGLSASGGVAAPSFARSFSRRRRATDSEALPGLESIHEGMHGGPTETSMGSPGLASADPKTDADDAEEEEEEEDVKVSKIRLVLIALAEREGLGSVCGGVEG